MTRDPALAMLRARRLLPEAKCAAHLPDLGTPDVALRDKYRGALLAGAVGDALGRPAEGCTRQQVRERFGELRTFVPHAGWRSGPKGTFTDDTQLSICVAESLVRTGGRLDPAHLAARFVDAFPSVRGIGDATRKAFERLASGAAWFEAGTASAGNGAAMRAAPVGLAHPSDVEALRRDAVLQAVITHADPMAVASSVAMAFATAWCLHHPPGTLDPQRLLAAVHSAVADLHDPGAVERKPAAHSPVRLADRLLEIPGLLNADPAHAFDYFCNGAFVLESLPAALWCFLRSPEDLECVLVTAVNGGHDADTVASMAGNLAGAYLGVNALPAAWVEDLEARRHLEGLADAVFTLVRHPADM